MLHTKLILCPVDFSANSVFALRIAQDIARQNDGTLWVLHVADTLGPEKLGFAEAAKGLQPESHIADLQKQLNHFAPSQSGLNLRHLLEEGDPALVIDKVARQLHCDLVVLGTHGRTGLDHLIMGSIAEKVVRLCPCPVLVVKYPKAGPAA